MLQFEETAGPGRIPRERIALWFIAAAALLSCVLYLNLTVQMTLLEHFPGPRRITVDFAKMLGDDWLDNTILLCGSFVTLFMLYLLALGWLFAAGASRAVLATVALTPVAFVAILTFMYPPQAVDFIHNLSDARTLWVFGENAMIVPPEAHPLPVAQSFDHEAAPYGPLWFLLLFPVKFLPEDNLQLQLHVLKLYTSLWFLGSALLVYLITRRLRPGRELFALALYAWNPFVVMRLAGNGHNDGTLMFFVLLAAWLFVSGHHRWVLPALAASVLVKYVTVLAVPPLVLAGFLAADDRRRYVLDTAIGGALALVLAVAAFACFWEGSATFDVLRDQAGRFISSTPTLVRGALVDRDFTPDEASELAQRLTGIAFGLVYTALAILFGMRRRRPAEVVAWMALVLLAYLVVAVTWYRPWYMLWPVTLLALVPGRWPVALFLVASFCNLFPDIIEIYRSEVDWLNEHYTVSDSLPAVTAFVPAVLVVFAAWLFGGRAFLAADGDAAAGTPVSGAASTSARASRE